MATVHIHAIETALSTAAGIIKNIPLLNSFKTGEPLRRQVRADVETLTRALFAIHFRDLMNCTADDWSDEDINALQRIQTTWSMTFESAYNIPILQLPDTVRVKPPTPAVAARAGSIIVNASPAGSAYSGSARPSPAHTPARQQQQRAAAGSTSSARSSRRPMDEEYDEKGIDPRDAEMAEMRKMMAQLLSASKQKVSPAPLRRGAGNPRSRRVDPEPQPEEYDQSDDPDY